MGAHLQAREVGWLQELHVGDALRLARLDDAPGLRLARLEGEPRRLRREPLLLRRATTRGRSRTKPNKKSSDFTTSTRKHAATVVAKVAHKNRTTTKTADEPVRFCSTTTQHDYRNNSQITSPTRNVPSGQQTLDNNDDPVLL